MTGRIINERSEIRPHPSEIIHARYSYGNQSSEGLADLFANYANSNIELVVVDRRLKVGSEMVWAVVAERLRRLTRNQIPSGSVGSNPTDCDYNFFFTFKCKICKKNGKGDHQRKSSTYVNAPGGPLCYHSATYQNGTDLIRYVQLHPLACSVINTFRLLTDWEMQLL